MKKIDPIGSRTAELQWEMQTRNLLKATADSMRLHCWSQIQKHALAAEFADGHQSWASLRMKEFAQKPITYFLLQHANWKLSNFVMFSVLLLFSSLHSCICTSEEFVLFKNYFVLFPTVSYLLLTAWFSLCCPGWDEDFATVE
jgi:hypothetical protein